MYLTAIRIVLIDLFNFLNCTALGVFEEDKSAWSLSLGTAKY
jgi:hypothetical protein